MREFDYNKLLKTVPIEQGMTVDVASDLFNLITVSREQGFHFDPNAFIDAICAAVGPEGTVLIRTFSWNFCHGKGFDIRKTGSRVGALGNIALKRQDFQRTKHPIYSWMVWGKNKNLFCRIDNIESFGTDSIFAWESANDTAVQINFGELETVGLTIVHFVEYKIGVPYRYVKNFTDVYIDSNGYSSKKTYSMYVRNLNYDTTVHVEMYYSKLEKNQGKLRSSYLGIPVELFRLNKLCEIFENDIKKNVIPQSVSMQPINPET